MPKQEARAALESQEASLKERDAQLAAKSGAIAALQARMDLSSSMLGPDDNPHLVSMFLHHACACRPCSGLLWSAGVQCLHNIYSRQIACAGNLQGDVAALERQLAEQAAASSRERGALEAEAARLGESLAAEANQARALRQQLAAVTAAAEAERDAAAHAQRTAQQARPLASPTLLFFTPLLASCALHLHPTPLSEAAQLPLSHMQLVGRCAGRT